MKIAKALITFADPKQRSLPLQTIIDQKGKQSTALELVLAEALSAGIEDVCLIVCPGDEKRYAEAAGSLANRVSFLAQPEPTGYAEAVLLGQQFTGDEPFLHMVGDHLCVSTGQTSCASQVVEAAKENNSCVSGVQATRESLLRSFGAVGGRLIDSQSKLYQIEKVLEKPSPTEAELELLVPGLRAGFYLCFFGIHVLKPSLYQILEKTTRSGAKGAKSLSFALSQLCQSEKHLALEVAGNRYDIGAAYGLLFSQLALSLDGVDKDRVMSGLLELLAAKH